MYTNNMEPKDLKIIGHCAYCGDEIYEGENVFKYDGKLVHKECVLEYMENELGVNFIAELCGFENVIA